MTPKIFLQPFRFLFWALLSCVDCNQPAKKMGNRWYNKVRFAFDSLDYERSSLDLIYITSHMFGCLADLIAPRVFALYPVPKRHCSLFL